MFTGLVEEIGTVAELVIADGGSAVLRVNCNTVLDGVRVGDSIAVNGCCLTVTEHDSGHFTADLMGETLKRTGFAEVGVGDKVNLERALRHGDRLGGHLVQGHVDGTGTIFAIEPHHEWTSITYNVDPALTRYIAEKGSVTIDGTSLTVVTVDTIENTFTVGLIPHTLAVTIHGKRRVGDMVNLEVDVIAKYVESLLQCGVQTPYSAVAVDDA